MLNFISKEVWKLYHIKSELWKGLKCGRNNCPRLKSFDKTDDCCYDPGNFFPLLPYLINFFFGDELKVFHQWFLLQSIELNSWIYTSLIYLLMWFKEHTLLVMAVTAVVKMVTVERWKEIVTEILIVSKVIRDKLMQKQFCFKYKALSI